MELGETIGALIQANAALDAARVQADAAISSANSLFNAAIAAAFIQGLLTLLAGGFVLYAARVQYRGALDQVQHVKDAAAARRNAYLQRTRNVVFDLLGRLSFGLEEAERLAVEYRKNPVVSTSPFVTRQAIQLPIELSDSRWEDQALLGNQFVAAAIDVERAVRQYERWQDHVKANSWTVQSTKGFRYTLGIKTLQDINSLNTAYDLDIVLLRHTWRSTEELHQRLEMLEALTK